ncbi:hypothetical protein D3P09_16060 [Paenibacillus pinisoli]|uniref:DUF4367 domain-containing protein n=1 Tax=Paenibacillus pinisoli TaxID=1276110 RepID=A0A3A6PDZ2_9BACL|nr:hypothetical protein [Paenibacillus pinisoli]RJX39017.1 hypothetical protein D3P09_16060 [Paenibacillus pinisoli]
MDSNLNIDQLIHQMKETKIPEVEISGKVMQEVLSFQGNQKRQWFRMSPIWAAICAVLVISTASVSAAALLKTNWNGIQINISDRGESILIPADKDELSFKDKFETYLAESSTIWEKISADEASVQFPFPLLRPQDSKFTLVQSFGVIPKDPDYRMKTIDEWYLGGFFDIFRWKQSEVMVKQDLDGHMADTVKDPSKTLELNFGASWEYVEVTDDILAMFSAGDIENRLLVSYKTADHNVITLELWGDMAKDDLIALAKTYVKN